MATDLSYLSVYKPRHMYFWFESMQPESNMKEMGVIIPSSQEILLAAAAAAENTDFARSLDAEMRPLLEKIDDGTAVSELQELAAAAEENADEIKALLMPIIAQLTQSARYQIRALPVNEGILKNVADLLGSLQPKPLGAEDIRPPESLVDFQSEEWTAFKAKGLA